MASESSVMAVIRASRPSFRNPHDKVAFAVHSAFLAAGYALTATGKAALSDAVPAGDEEVGIEGWNECDGCYGFVYVKEEKGVKRRVLVKCLAVGDVLVVDVLRLDKDQKEPFNLQIEVKDCVPDVTTSRGNYGDMYRNFKDLVDSVNKRILVELEPPPRASSSSAAARGFERGRGFAQERRSLGEEVASSAMASESSVMAVIRTSCPSFPNPHDKVAFAVHSAFFAAGYALTATGMAALSGAVPAGDEEVGIEGWNECEDCYGFVYVKEEKGVKRRVLVKCFAVRGALVVDVFCLDAEQKEPFNLQIEVKDYVPGYVPDDTTSTGNYGDMYQNIKDLVDSVNKRILGELEPPPRASSSSLAARRVVAEPTSHQPAVGVPAYPQPYSPFIYQPGACFIHQRWRSGVGNLFAGPNDPRFGRLDLPDLRYPGGLAGIQPSARFDPIGPPDFPGFECGRFIGPPRRPWGRTHPDLEHFQGPDYI